jgi:Tol biopolymer transport system component
VPGGFKVAYLAYRDGTAARRILRDVVGDIRAMTWSHDGSRMAFIVKDEAHPDGALWTAAADGTGAALVYDGHADGCDSVFHPAWSPDDAAIAIVCWDEPDAVLAVLQLEGMRLTRLAAFTPPEVIDTPPRWSHDGGTIAFAVLHWDPTNAFQDGSRHATIKSDASSEPVYLTEFASFASSPDWSPDDRRLVYNTNDLGNMLDADLVSDLWTIGLDGSAPTPLSAAADAGVDRLGNSRWDPDGSRIWIGVVDGDARHIGWVDPASGSLTTLALEGGGVDPQP